MKKIHIFVIGFLFCFHLFNAPCVIAQISWAYTYGDSSTNQSANDVVQTSDTGYIVVGSVVSKALTDFLVLKLDKNGNLLWTRTYGNSSTNEIAYSICQNQDGTYTIAGDYYFIKINSVGDTIWTRNSQGFIKCLQKTVDGGYVLAGTLGYDCYLEKTNDQGLTTWIHTYARTGYMSGTESVRQTKDGGYILGGWNYYDYYTRDVYVVKTDSVGNKIWDLVFDLDYAGTTASKPDVGYSILQLPDGGYLVAGQTGEPNGVGGRFYTILALKIDSSGNISWYETYSGDSNYSGYAMDKSTDGNFVIVGRDPENTRNKSYFIKINSAGDPLWTQVRYGINGNSVKSTSDGGYVIVGTIQDLVTSNYLVEVMKVTGNGTFTDVKDAVYFMPKVYSLSQNYPNPFNPSTTIKFSLGHSGFTTLKIFDLMGREIETLVSKYLSSGEHAFQWNAGNYPTSVYFYKLQAGKYTETKKLLLLK
jgi:hypothetical protein